MKKLWGLLVGSILLFSLGKITPIQAKEVNQKQIDRLVKKMTLEEKIGQMYLVPSSGNASEMATAVKQYHLGGIVLFGADFQNQTQAQLRDKIKNWQNTSQYGLFIATDQEGGTVSRLSANPNLTKRNYPSPQDTYAKAGIAGVVKEYQKSAQILHKLGINWNFAPVADVSSDKNSFIYARTLGQNYQITADYVRKVVPAIQRQKVIASLKHFPGYGSAADTHTGFASDNRSLNEFKANDFLPFAAGIKAKVDTVLVAHIVMSSVDNQYPASLSPAVHKLLRDELRFKGVIVTDDMGMGAIKEFAQKQSENPDVLAVKAGNDVILSNGYMKGIPAIEAAVKKGQISKKQIDQSVKRILKLKAKENILK